MRALMLILLVALSSGCSAAKETTLPDGEMGYFIHRCPDLSYCYERAAKLCGGKYTIVSQQDDTSSMPVLVGATAVPMSIAKQSIMVKCSS